MSHQRTVQAEFSRQAEPFARADVLRAPEITERLVEALGSQAEGLVLDLACGPGLVTRVLGERARLAVGLDLTRRMLEVAAAAAPGPRCGFVRGAAERAPFREGCFDGITLRLALHHMPEPLPVLREARRLLRPGGRLVVLDVLTDPDPAVAERHNALERERDPSHTAFRPAEALRRDLAEAGLALRLDERWRTRRGFAEWAAIIDEPERMARVERRMRQLVAEGEGLGIDLREEDGALCFDYRWALLAADAE